jgi:hypothetical protein
MKEEAMDRAAVEFIALQTINLLRRVLELPFDTIDLIPKRKSDFDHFRRVGGHSAKVCIEALN